MTESCQWRPVAFRRRLLLVMLVMVQTLAGIWLFAHSLPDGIESASDNWAIIALIGVFSILFAWIGVGFWTAVLGFVSLRRGGDFWSLSRRYGTADLENTAIPPTAVVMPICHEPVQRTLSGLSTIYRDLAQQGNTNAVDFYVLSDSRDPEIWLEEQAVCNELRKQLGAEQRLFYRRRTVNLNHKSGNIADFLRRWGQNYRYMVVLDADSLLSGACITRLVRLMERRPQVGIIQTAPRLARADTRFARLQQFANRCYGRLYSAGLAAIQLGEATYWGHNAVIRVAPFMRHCGLRKLRGRGLFSGPVLSHDFVEAALMGRAGYEVWLEPAIGGSFEESPPTLEDDLIRDRRWCRGNLQHLWLLATLERLPLAHRMALVNGILSYLASPLWLIFLGLSGYVAIAGAAPVMPGVLASSYSGPGSSFLLITIIAALLFGPRLLAMADQALAGRVKLFGGTRRLAASTLCETVIALALAPIRMVAHTIYVVRALFNVPIGWQGQNRTRQTSLQSSIQRFCLPLGLVAVLLGVGQWHAPALTLWALPVAFPILLSPLLALWLNRKPANPSWLTTPEQHQAPRVIAMADTISTSGKIWEALSWVEQAVLTPARVKSASHGDRVLAGKKREMLLHLVGRCATGGVSELSHREMSLICSQPAALEALHLQAWQSRPGSPWQQALDRMAQSMNSFSGPDRRPATGVSEEALWIDAVS